MSTGYVVYSVLIIAVALAIITLVLLQQDKSSGLSSAMTGMGDTYWDQHKDRSIEGTLERYTKIGGGVFLLLIFLFPLIVK